MGRSGFAPSGVSYFANFTEHECAVVNDGNSGWADSSVPRLDNIDWINPQIKKFLDSLNDNKQN